MPLSSEEYPNRFDFSQAQPRIYQFWEKGQYFHAEPGGDRQPYTIVIPPPNVTGALHLGHALNNTLQDIVIRMKRMQGFNTLWMPGTDHAGIATQAVVEKRLLEEEKKTRHDLGREKLVERIWEWKAQYEARIISQLKQMGCSCDWQRTRFTLDDVCARAVRHTFSDLFRKGLIYRGKKLVNWDTHLQTAVSDDEVFHENVKGHFWHIRYPVIEPKPGEPSHVTIATTRPETMLGDTAVAVHPDPAAQLRKVEDELSEKLAKASDKEKDDYQAQLDNVRQRHNTMLGDLELLRDMANDGRRLMLPLVEREIPLIADKWAKPELGSGCVKITPAHDQNDYDVFRRNPEIGAINILNPNGTLNQNAGKYQGLLIKKGREQCVADLEEQGLLVEIEDREIELAHSDRSKTAIEPYLANQWFVNMDQPAQSAMDAVTDERVKIFPPRYAKAYLDWLGEKRDWCISRNLWWGHQIPVWSKPCKTEAEHKCELEQLLADGAISSGEIPHQVEENPEYDAADESSIFSTLHVCINDDDAETEARFESLGYTREEDVLDTWFSSALWPHSTLGWPDKTEALDYYYPTSVLITSRDIITLWVARMVLTGLNNMQEIPFHHVYIHPKILDGDGETMSKSKGNGIDPLDVIEKFGADALRFGMAYLATDMQDVRMPVQFECPHCGKNTNQTKKNRQLPRIQCKDCGKEFSTQWAESEEDKSLPRAPVISERFELARNFGNKLWNASRFALLNLADVSVDAISDDELATEDRWILSRLSTVTQTVTESLEGYHYADAARAIYDFAWDEFCSFYIEMVKERLLEKGQQRIAGSVLAHTLDNLLRLLHPMIPFITEEVWQMFAKIVPKRGISSSATPAESIMTAEWPQADHSRQDPEIEARFAKFQSVLGAIREIRSGQNIPPKESIEFCVRCDDDTVSLLEPMEPFFNSMAKAKSVAWGPDITPPKRNATTSLTGIDVYVDLRDFFDAGAERDRLSKELTRLQGMAAGKQKKLENANFVERAPADVVQRERDSLAEIQEQIRTLTEALQELADE